MTHMQGPSPETINKASFGWSWADAGFASGLLGLSPLLYEHSLNLWGKPHFQFFPIAWFLFAWLVYSRGKITQTDDSVRGLLAISLTLLSVVVGVASVAWFSPWLAHVAMVFVCAGWMYSRLGGNTWHQPVAWLSLLLISLPMPLNLDQRLIQSLQSLSARSASSLLDVLDVPHLPTGNVVEIRTGKLFVDEACSGVDSLYALAAVALGLVIWNQRNFLQSLMVLLTVPLWAWLGNTIRILSIVILLDRFNIDLTHGWPHSLLGMLTFAISCICLISIQLLFTTLLTPFSFSSIVSGPFHTLFNWVVSFPQEDPAKITRREFKSQIQGKSETTSTLSRSLGIIHCATWILLSAVAVLPVLGIGPWKREFVATPVFSQSSVEQTIVADSLPASLAGMRQVAFWTVHRDNDNTNGAHSAAWQYMDGEQQIQVSIDFPFVGFHALEVCYLLTGCTLTNPVQNVDIELGGTLSQLVINEFHFVNALSDECFACYTAFDRQGESVSGTNSRLLRGTALEDVPHVSFQVQLLIEGCGNLTDEQRGRFRKILAEICEKILPVINALPDH